MEEENEKFRREILFKEIDLIEACITRMANNSFLIKGWTAAIVSALLAVMEQKDNMPYGSMVALVVATVFWYLDTYYLNLERLYRHKFNWVVENRLQSNEFIFDLNPYMNVEKNRKDSYTVRWDVVFSKTLELFYGSITFILSSSIFFSNMLFFAKLIVFIYLVALIYLMKQNWGMM